MTGGGTRGANFDLLERGPFRAGRDSGGTRLRARERVIGPRGDALLANGRDGLERRRIDGTYPMACYRHALHALPEDIALLERDRILSVRSRAGCGRRAHPRRRVRRVRRAAPNTGMGSGATPWDSSALGGALALLVALLAGATLIVRREAALQPDALTRGRFLPGSHPSRLPARPAPVSPRRRRRRAAVRFGSRTTRGSLTAGDPQFAAEPVEDLGVDSSASPFAGTTSPAGRRTTPEPSRPRVSPGGERPRAERAAAHGIAPLVTFVGTPGLGERREERCRAARRGMVRRLRVRRRPPLPVRPLLDDLERAQSSVLPPADDRCGLCQQAPQPAYAQIERAIPPRSSPEA